MTWTKERKGECTNEKKQYGVSNHDRNDILDSVEDDNSMMNGNSEDMTDEGGSEENARNTVETPSTKSTDDSCSNENRSVLRNGEEWKYKKSGVQRRRQNEPSRKRIRMNMGPSMPDSLEMMTEKVKWSEGEIEEMNGIVEIVSFMKNVKYPNGLSYEVLVSGHQSAQQMTDIKQFFYKSIVYTVYLERIRHFEREKPLPEKERTRLLYSLEDYLSSKNKVCDHMYKWIIYFCPFLAHRFGSRFMNNVKRAYLTQKKNHTLSEYIEDALDMTICSEVDKETCEKKSDNKNLTDQIMRSIKELKSMVQIQYTNSIDYSGFDNSELREIINSSFRKLSILCNNVSELDRDKLINLVQHVTAMNGLLSI